MSLGQIAQAVNLPRSTVQRIVSALALEGLATTGGGHGRIKLGPECQALALHAGGAPKDRLRPILEQLAKTTGETVDLAVLRGGRMLFVDQIEGHQRLRTVSKTGETFPLTTTANGKAALACLDEIRATELILAERHMAEGAKTSIANLLAEIAQIQQGAFALDLGAHTEGISAIGLGFADPSGEVYAVSIPVPSARFDRHREALETALTAARQHLL